jgi:hypothetical protein
MTTGQPALRRLSFHMGTFEVDRPLFRAIPAGANRTKSPKIDGYSYCRAVVQRKQYHER